MSPAESMAATVAKTALPDGRQGTPTAEASVPTRLRDVRRTLTGTRCSTVSERRLVDLQTEPMATDRFVHAASDHHVG